jgi:hypothetical protein
MSTLVASRTPTAVLTSHPVTATPPLQPTSAPTGIPAPQAGYSETTTTYTYDLLYRPTAADYSTGEYFHYTYDSVGNRLTEETAAGTKNHTYDIANRLTSVAGMNYA